MTRRTALDLVVLGGLLLWVGSVLVGEERRHTTVPVALTPACLVTRIHHPDPRRRVRRVDSCHPLDTIVEPR